MSRTLHVRDSHMMSDTAQPSRAWRRLPRPKQVCHFVCAVAVVAGVVVLGQQLHRAAGTKMQGLDAIKYANARSRDSRVSPGRAKGATQPIVCFGAECAAQLKNRKEKLKKLKSPKLSREEVLRDCPWEFGDEPPLDIVYTWVNWTAPAFIAQMKAAGPEMLHGALEPEAGMRQELSAGGSFDELKYSLRSLGASGMAARARKIYIVLNPVHGPPAWLLAHPKVEVVPHAAIMAAAHLPSNNYFAIQVSAALACSRGGQNIATRC